MKGKVILTVGIVMISFMFLLSSVHAQTVKAYMGLSPDNNAKIVSFIKDKTGIEILQTFQSFGELEARVKSEAPNFNGDMVGGCGSSLAFWAKKNKFAVPYQSPGWKGVDPIFIDPEGYWFNIANFSFVVVGNKDKLAKAGYTLPKSWKELLDPKWKDHIVMPSPLTSGTGAMVIYTFVSLMGEEQAWKFLEDLDKNINHYTRSGNGPSDLVGRGEFMLAITSDEMVKTRMDQGYPLVWTIPEEGTGYEGTFLFILPGTKMMDACKKIIDVEGTSEFSKMLASLGYVTPRPAPSALYGEKPPKYVKLDLAKAAENRAKWNEMWKSKFREGKK